MGGGKLSFPPSVVVQSAPPFPTFLHSSLCETLNFSLTHTYIHTHTPGPAASKSTGGGGNLKEEKKKNPAPPSPLSNSVPASSPQRSRKASPPPDRFSARCPTGANRVTVDKEEEGARRPRARKVRQVSSPASPPPPAEQKQPHAPSHPADSRLRRLVLPYLLRRSSPAAAAAARRLHSGSPPKPSCPLGRQGWSPRRACSGRSTRQPKARGSLALSTFFLPCLLASDRSPSGRRFQRNMGGGGCGGGREEKESNNTKRRVLISSCFAPGEVAGYRGGGRDRKKGASVLLRLCPCFFFPCLLPPPPKTAKGRGRKRRRRRKGRGQIKALLRPTTRCHWRMPLADESPRLAVRKEEVLKYIHPWKAAAAAAAVRAFWLESALVVENAGITKILHHHHSRSLSHTHTFARWRRRH